MDRRASIQWLLAAGAALPGWAAAATGTQEAARAGHGSAADAAAGRGYGSDPRLLAEHASGKYWPLVLTATERQRAGVLADLILPEDAHSPAATAVGIVDFIDEWVSAPYPAQQQDLELVRMGVAWLDTEALRRFQHGFDSASAEERRQICDDVCSEVHAATDAGRGAAEHHAAVERRAAARFFARFRDIVAGGFYSSPAGRKDLGYIGNVALIRFDGPPAELLARLNLP